jgi:SAM-dependent methyltransferase
MFSIDQNCHSLWDVIPKLAALSARGHRVRHFIEDIDVAFTSLGSAVEGGPLRLAKERFHRSGGQDWGAALFYSEFLGKMPVEIRDWEPLVGMKTNALAKQLGRSVDDVYDEFSPGDNWQLIGPSYVGDRHNHRVVGDLSVEEVAEFVREMMAKARGDMLHTFPDRASQTRLAAWFDSEDARLAELLQKNAGGTLVDLYRDWLEQYLGNTVAMGLTSELFACKGAMAGTELLEFFCRDYDLAAGLYNEALAEVASPMRPLKTSGGELPFFATSRHKGHTVRTGMSLAGGEIRVGTQAFALAPDRRPPMNEMASAGVLAVAGKAVVLVIQARLGEHGEALALPYRGSLYMPAANRFAKKLAERGLIGPELRPIVRVRFRLLDRMGGLDTTIRLPAHLAGCFGCDEISARDFAAAYPAIAADAAARLEAFNDPRARRRWQQETFPEVFAEMGELDSRRRGLATKAPKSEEIRQIWKRIKALQTGLLEGTLRQIAADHQATEMDYSDSRGAVIPWSIALGGEEFYDDLIAGAEIYEEPLPKFPAARARSIASHYERRIVGHRENHDILDWADAETQHKRFEVLAEAVALEGKKLLDVGSGLGDLLAFLKRQGITVDYTGIDIVEKMTKAAKERQPDGRFLVGDIFADDLFEPETFDVVFCSGTFNLNLGNNLEFLPKAVGRMLELTRKHLVFNLLHKRMADDTERYFYCDPAEVLVLLKPLGCEMEILDAYLPNDFTVICRKRPGQS